MAGAARPSCRRLCRLWVGVGLVVSTDGGWSTVYTDRFGAADPLSSLVSATLSALNRRR